MYPSSSSSSSHGSLGPSREAGGGLSRYGSAPGSLLTAAVDSTVGPTPDFTPAQPAHHVGPTRFFPPSFSDAESASRPSDPGQRNGLQRSRCLNEFASAFNDLKGRASNGTDSSSSSPPALSRHRSSPAGFLSGLTAAATAVDNGFSRSRGSYGSSKGGAAGDHGCGLLSLSSQLSFTRQDSLPRISEEGDNAAVDGGDGQRKASHSYATASFAVAGPWDDNNSIVFSSPQTKRTKTITTDDVNGIGMVESQLQFGLSQSALEAAEMDKLIEIPQDSVPCKIRAKRGCATHPRSIAERERRTRISGKLKKLQDLVPNMDKQTSYADMLDLAVQHIKGLQTQVQDLNKELENCTCGCKERMHI